MSTRLEWGKRSSTIKEEAKEDDEIGITNEMYRVCFKPVRVV